MSKQAVLAKGPAKKLPKPTPKKTKSVQNLQELTNEYIRLFQKYYPNAHCALDHSSPEELLVATILSAQCTDARVNIVTKTLFKKYPTMKAYADAKIEELEEDIRTTGFYKNKAKSLKGMAELVVQNYKGKVPRTLEQLVELPGVGRKTANVVLGNSFHIASGIVVDTHVTRLSNRMGLTKHNSDAVKIEKDLVQLVPEKHWIQFSHWLIEHGRQVCKARKPQCEVCFLQLICPKKI